MAFNNSQYQANYIKENMKRVEIKIDKRNCQDMIDWLNGKDNVQAYIKDLIRKDMEAHQDDA